MGPPDELPGNDWTSGLLMLFVWLKELPIPRALAVPKPVEGWGLLLGAIERLSKVQAVRMDAASNPESEVSSKPAMQTVYFILIIFSLVSLVCLDR